MICDLPEDPTDDKSWNGVLAESSDAVMLQPDTLDLWAERASNPSRPTPTVYEYFDTFRLDENVDWNAPSKSLASHGHCHQKAMKKDHHIVSVLRRAGYAVDPLDSDCCGMAGSFVYEAEHYC